MNLAQILALIGSCISIVAIISGVIFIFNRRMYDVDTKSHGNETMTYNWKNDEKPGSFYMKIKLSFLTFIISSILSVSISITAMIINFLV